MNFSHTLKENGALRKLLQAYAQGPIGFSCFLAWLYVSFYSCALLPVISTTRTSERFWGIMAGAGVIGALVALFLLRRNVDIAGNPRIHYAAALCCGVGSLFIYLSCSQAPVQWCFTITGSIFSGVGFVFLAFMWRSVLGKYDESLIELSVPLSFFISVLLYFLLVAIKNMATMVIIALLPLVSVLFALRGISLLTGQASDDAAQTKEFRRKQNHLTGAACFKNIFSREKLKAQGGHPFPTAIMFFVIWANFAFFRAFWSPTYITNRFTHYIPPFTAAALLALFVLVITIFRAKSVNYRNAYRWVLPITCLGYALLYVLNGRYIEIAYALNFTGLIVMQLYFWIVSAKRMRRGGGEASQILFGIFLLFFLAGTTFGISVGLWTLEHVDTETLYKVLPFIMTGLTAIVMLLGVKSEHYTPDQKQTLSFGEVVHAQASAIAEQFNLTSREQEILIYLLAGRSRPFIRDELVISLSTVNSHVKNIYMKTAVHSYQELLDLAQQEIKV
ncbi:MAG: helix-turn-helix transcriptional regulator [Raoultibacter sp.]